MAIEIYEDKIKKLGEHGFEFTIKSPPFGIITQLWKKSSTEGGWRVNLPSAPYEVDGVRKTKSLVFLDGGSKELYEQLTVALHKKLMDLGHITGDAQKNQPPF